MRKQPDKNLLKMVKRPEQSPHQRKFIDGKWPYEKMLCVIVIRKSWKLKQKWDTTHAYQSGKYQNSDSTKCCHKDMEFRNSHSMLGEMQNYTATLETSLAVSYKTNILFSCHPEVAFTGFIYSNEFKGCPHKNLHMHVVCYSNFIYNC